MVECFLDMVSSETNRATFIQNLLGFLSEYDNGVDFDWEYPGADNRGGSDSDGVNYTAFLKELRAAINAGGKKYIVTFTVPTSYCDNPIGNQILAHTTLTEIDLVLDLFWRVEVDPSAIKPGCAFSGSGAKEKCTDTAGILSYLDIQEIIDDAGGTAYLYEKAAVKYMIYINDNWISFDDSGTFKQKIDYANKMGLSGLMVWAIDLNDNYLGVLRSISDSQYIENGRNIQGSRSIPILLRSPCQNCRADTGPIQKS
ncbi:hypothetical protein N7495_006497 [Penicillium taxi]|uniref:uncharacterized protein n=1 Tax=Penicillium taxi TaxID=168475 RepID=UPI002544DA5E|nr:uncharacterized protein N7495_006497 [Penicillium taxi]KAJ5894806.1 hypothetical protein N7495_006497 [Penicillium taxi]